MLLPNQTTKKANVIKRRILYEHGSRIANFFWMSLFVLTAAQAKVKMSVGSAVRMHVAFAARTAMVVKSLASHVR